MSQHRLTTNMTGAMPPHASRRRCATSGRGSGGKSAISSGRKASRFRDELIQHTHIHTHARTKKNRDSHAVRGCVCRDAWLSGLAPAQPIKRGDTAVEDRRIVRARATSTDHTEHPPRAPYGYAPHTPHGPAMTIKPHLASDLPVAPSKAILHATDRHTTTVLVA